MMLSIGSEDIVADTFLNFFVWSASNMLVKNAISATPEKALTINKVTGMLAVQQ